MKNETEINQNLLDSAEPGPAGSSEISNSEPYHTVNDADLSNKVWSISSWLSSIKSENNQ